MRLAALRKVLERRKLDGAVLTGRANTFWLSGFTGSTSLLLVTRQQAFLIADFRYAIQSRAQATGGITAMEIDDSFHVTLERLLARNNVRTLGYEGDVLTVSEFEQFKERLRTPSRYVNLSADLPELRLRKDAGELEAILHAVGIGDAVYREILPEIREGVKEADLAAEMEYRMRRHGAQGPAFETIVASGPNAAICHATATARSFRPGDAIVMDFGVKWNGYCSDMTRTVFLGEPGPELRRIYQIVLKAQMAALAALRCGILGSEADRVARRIIADAGHESHFGHSLGHGVGIEIHEDPRISTPSADMLEDGMVFTVEPGIYLEGIGGVRIEDMGAFIGGNFRNFTASPKEMLIL